MQPPNKKKKAPTDHLAADASATRFYPHPVRAQERDRTLTLFRWTRESERLLGLWWHTGKLVHLSAFVRHVIAMRRRLERAQS